MRVVINLYNALAILRNVKMVNTMNPNNRIRTITADHLLSIGIVSPLILLS